VYVGGSGRERAVAGKAWYSEGRARCRVRSDTSSFVAGRPRSAVGRKMGKSAGLGVGPQWIGWRRPLWPDAGGRK
jgi:hypothetical protein